VDPSCSLSAAATFTTREAPHPSHGHPSHGHTVTVTQHGLQGIQGCGAPSRNSCGAGGSKGEMGSRIWDGDILGYSWSPGKWELWIKGYTGIMYCIHIYIYNNIMYNIIKHGDKRACLKWGIPTSDFDSQTDWSHESERFDAELGFQNNDGRGLPLSTT
jgi:hypothetical protein